MNIASAFKRGVINAGLLPWWENHVSSWPHHLLYHLVGDDAPPFLRECAVGRSRFLEQILTLAKRYRFLAWPEYKQVLSDPIEAKGTLLLTFDDGFQSSWKMVQDLASDHGIPSVFFVNTRTLDNQYLPWHQQFYFLKRVAGEQFLQPLWNSIGSPASPNAERQHCHDHFSLNDVVAPIEEGLAKFGMKPAEVAQRSGLFMPSADLARRGDLIEIGNHSHSHYILSKLSDQELDEDLSLSHTFLAGRLGAAPEAFAYPFGEAGFHFNGRCLEHLRRIGAYPHVFSATGSPHNPALQDYEQNRTSFETQDPQDVIATASSVSPRYLLKWLGNR